MHPLRTHSIRSWRSVGIRPWTDGEHRDRAGGIVYSIDNSIGAASGTVAIGQRRHDLLADTMRVCQEGSDDELVCRERDRRGQPFG